MNLTFSTCSSWASTSNFEDIEGGWAKTISFSSQIEVDCFSISSCFISSSVLAWLLADSSQKKDKYWCADSFSPIFAVQD